jgi:hypothetical protein
MNFGQAIEAMKQGKKMTRFSWKNSRFLWLKPATDTISVCFQEMGGALNNTTGWVPQQRDLFAEDWEVFE